MIQHFPTQFVSFENSGCARVPEYPLVGEATVIECAAEGESARLAWRVNGAEQPQLQGTALGEGRFRFELPAFLEPCRISYKIQSGEESSREFTFPVCRSQRYSSFRHVCRRDDQIIASLDAGICVTFDTKDGLNVNCAYGQADGEPVERAFLALGDAELCVGGKDALWRLGKKDAPLVQATAIEITYDEAGRVIRSQVLIKIPCRAVLGTGERFDRVNQLGLGSSGLVEERCFYQEEVTYFPVPFFFTDSGVGLLCNGSVPAAFRFDPEVFSITREATEKTIFSDTLFTGRPQEILAQFYGKTGRPKLPPDWSFGVWMSANGWNRTEEVYEVLDEMKKNNYPASVLVLEPWSDEKTYRVWDEERFHDHAQMVKDARAAGLHMVLWQISTIHKSRPGWHCADEDEALENGYYIHNSDGTPYRVPDGWCKGAMVCDFTNPAARDWWFGTRKHLLDEGVEGFKTDGGEYLFDKDIVLYDGTRGLEARNRHPLDYQRAYHEFFEKNGVNGITFSRSGFVGCQTTPLHWAGDQSSEWRELRGQLRAGITAGLSGIIFWGFDIGSLAGDLPDKELYLRSTALACFCPVMQWHSTVMPHQLAPRLDQMSYNDRSPWNLARQFHDPEIMELSAQFARLRHTLIPYIVNESKYCVEQGRPLMAHLCFDFPEDGRAWQTEDEYMFGREYLVAPIVEQGRNERAVYLPAGRWKDFFTGSVYEGGREWTLTCPLDRALVFSRV